MYSQHHYHHQSSYGGGSPRGGGLHSQPPTSPFVQFSGRTIEEHNVTLQRLDEQLQMIAQALADLEGQDEEDRLRSQNSVDQLRGEEEECIRRQHLIAQTAQDMERRMTEETSTDTHAQVLHEDELRELYSEDKALSELEEELKAMQAGIEDRIYHSREQLRIFRKELDDGMSILENDRHAVRAIASRTNEQFNNSRRTAEIVKSLSPNRAPRSPAPPSYPNGGSSPSSSSYYHSNSAVAAASSLSTSHLRRSDANVSMTRANNMRPSSPLGAPSGGGSAMEFRTISPERSGRGGLVSSPHRQQQQMNSSYSHTTTGMSTGLRSPPKPGRHNRIMADVQVNDPSMSAIKQRSLNPYSNTTAANNYSTSHSVNTKEVSFYNSQAPSPYHPQERLSNTGSFLPSINQGNNNNTSNHNMSLSNNSSRNGGQQQRLGGGGSALLEACARVPVDAQEVTTILRQDQGAVNELDQVDNTPLHILCMNERTSLDAVHALLLSGASTTAKNAAGFTPFHCACLNVRGDFDNVPSNAARHQLKKFLIFKGAQNPNQRTGKGETALHLCAEEDTYLPVVEFLVGAGVDPHVSALLSNGGSSRRMKALDVAKLGGGRSARIAAFLSSID